MSDELKFSMWDMEKRKRELSGNKGLPSSEGQIPSKDPAPAMHIHNAQPPEMSGAPHLSKNKDQNHCTVKIIDTHDAKHPWLANCPKCKGTGHKLWELKLVVDGKVIE